MNNHKREHVNPLHFDLKNDQMLSLGSPPCVGISHLRLRDVCSCSILCIPYWYEKIYSAKRACGEALDRILINLPPRGHSTPYLDIDHRHVYQAIVSHTCPLIVVSNIRNVKGSFTESLSAVYIM